MDVMEKLGQAIRNKTGTDSIQEAYDRMNTDTYWKKHSEAFKTAEEAYKTSKNKLSECDMEIARLRYLIDDTKYRGYKKLLSQSENQDQIKQEVKNQLEDLQQQLDLIKGIKREVEKGEQVAITA